MECYYAVLIILNIYREAPRNGMNIVKLFFCVERYIVGALFRVNTTPASALL